MKTLIVIFLCMFVYGAVAGYAGPGAIALFCAGFIMWADKKMRRNEARWARDPRNIKPPRNSTQVLSDYETEVSDRRFGL